MTPGRIVLRQPIACLRNRWKTWSSSPVPVRGKSAQIVPEEFFSSDATSFADARWKYEVGGRSMFFEIFAGSARLSQCCALSGMKVGTPIDIRNGFDIFMSKGRSATNRIVVSSSQMLSRWSLSVALCPICNTSMMGSPSNRNVARCCQRLIFVPKSLSANIHRQNRYFGVENPFTSKLWYAKLQSPFLNFRRNKVSLLAVLTCVVLAQEILSQCRCFVIFRLELLIQPAVDVPTGIVNTNVNMNILKDQPKDMEVELI